jgi:predicted ATPase/DNA-binding CsgD family transcriptional regulator
MRGHIKPNLPYRLTSFVGRNVELVELRRLLHERRLVTLTGAGGSGKTRLALEAATGLAAEFHDVLLVDLAPLAVPELVPETVARALGVEPAPGRPLLEALGQYLCGKAILLLLDNCEHLLDACAQFAAALLATCPELRVLATSREALGVGGECIFRVPLLAFPDPSAMRTLDELMEFEAVQLFVDRVRLAAPSFSLTEGNAAAVAQVCARLDGIPLALELAAATLRAMAIEDLAGRLDQRFRLLTSGGRTVLPRHRTLSALLDWSYALLAPSEQAVFRQIAVFPADWALDAAEVVCATESKPAAVLDAILEVVNKSLIQMDQAGGRYRMLETIRLYALEKLDDAGEREDASRRHFEWYREFSERGAPLLGGPEQQQWFMRLEREQPNFRAALTWAIERGLTDRAAILAFDLWDFWLARAYHHEARDRLEQILALEARAPLPALLRARLLSCLGVLAHTFDEFEKADHYHQEALRIWNAEGDSAGIAGVLIDLGWRQFQAMDLAGARRYAEESLALARWAGDPAAIAASLHLFGAASVEGGWLYGLAPLLEESLSIWRSLGVLPQVANVLILLARLEQRLGDLERAGTLLLDGLGLLISLGDYAGLIGSFVVMHNFAFGADGPPGESGQGMMGRTTYLDGGSLPHGPERAARVLGVIDAWERKVMGGHSVQWESQVVPLQEKLSAEMEEFAFAHEFAAGQALSLEGIVVLAEELVHPSAAHLTGPVTLASTVPSSQPVKPAKRPAGLTQRELEVLKLVADGLTNAQIAERLTVTPRTVNAHLTSIYSKAGVNGRAGAIRFAVDHGLI